MQEIEKVENSRQTRVGLLESHIYAMQNVAQEERSREKMFWGDWAIVGWEISDLRFFGWKLLFVLKDVVSLIKVGFLYYSKIKTDEGSVR